MENARIKTYLYYTSGVLEGRFQVREDRIFYQKRETVRRMWGEAVVFTEENNEFHHPLCIPVFKILEQIKSPKVDLGDNYEPYKKISGEINGEREEAVIWAQVKGNLPIDYILLKDEILGAIGNLRKKVSILIKEGYEALTPLIDYQDKKLSKPIYGVTPPDRKSVV